MKVKTKEDRIREFETFMHEATSSDEIAMMDVDITIMVTELDEMGFFTAPASTKYHGDYEGGLFDHSFAVAEALVDLTKKLQLRWWNPRSPYIIGMFHDLCKCDNYVFTEDGIEYNKSQALTGHGDKSVILLSRIIAKTSMMYLTDEEILSIRWHMGAFDEKENWKAYTKAIQTYPNVLYTHTADMIASHILGI